MAVKTWTELKTYRSTYITTNGTRAITGAVLGNTFLVDLLDTLESLVGGYSTSITSSSLNAKRQVTITHNIGKRPVHVTVMDATYTRIPDVNYVCYYSSTNAVRLTFPANFTGTLTIYIS
jgi:hypothetical protein